MAKEIKNTCSTCQYWKNEQAELEYSEFDGICVCPKWRFDNTNYSDVKVLDRNNLSNKHMSIHAFENTSESIPVGKVERSRYCFVTASEFGCIHHKLKKTVT